MGGVGHRLYTGRGNLGVIMHTPHLQGSKCVQNIMKNIPSVIPIALVWLATMLVGVMNDCYYYSGVLVQVSLEFV